MQSVKTPSTPSQYAAPIGCAFTRCAGSPSTQRLARLFCTLLRVYPQGIPAHLTLLTIYASVSFANFAAVLPALGFLAASVDYFPARTQTRPQGPFLPGFRQR
jgi:hypothetical protein